MTDRQKSPQITADFHRKISRTKALYFNKYFDIDTNYPACDVLNQPLRSLSIWASSGQIRVRQAYVHKIQTPTG